MFVDIRINVMYTPLSSQIFLKLITSTVQSNAFHSPVRLKHTAPLLSGIYLTEHAQILYMLACSVRDHPTLFYNDLKTTLQLLDFDNFGLSSASKHYTSLSRTLSCKFMLVFSVGAHACIPTVCCQHFCQIHIHDSSQTIKFLKKHKLLCFKTFGENYNFLY